MPIFGYLYFGYMPIFGYLYLYKTDKDATHSTGDTVQQLQ